MMVYAITAVADTVIVESFDFVTFEFATTFTTFTTFELAIAVEYSAWSESFVNRVADTFNLPPSWLPPCYSCD